MRPRTRGIEPGTCIFWNFLSIYRITLAIKANRKQANRSALQANRSAF